MKVSKFFGSLLVGLMLMQIVSPVFAVTTTGFSDVPSSYVYYDGVMYVQAKQVVSGYPDGTFKPDNKINRAEFTKILIASQYDASKISACKTQSFSDVESSKWYATYTCLAKQNKIVSGNPDGSFAPGQNIQFSAAAKIIALAFKLPVVTDASVWYKGYVDVLASKNAIPMSVTSFDYQITRGEMAEMIYRLKSNITNKSSQTYESLSGVSQSSNTDTSSTTTTSTSTTTTTDTSTSSSGDCEAGHTCYTASLATVAGATSPASGIGSFVMGGSDISYQIFVSGLTNTLTASHLHDSNGGAVIGSITFKPQNGGYFASGTLSGLTDAQVEDIKAGKVYANVHTDKYPNGEISGYLMMNK